MQPGTRQRSGGKAKKGVKQQKRRAKRAEWWSKEGERAVVSSPQTTAEPNAQTGSRLV